MKISQSLRQKLTLLITLILGLAGGLGIQAALTKKKKVTPPVVIKPGSNTEAPSDAIILFNGQEDLSKEWSWKIQPENKKEKEGWKVEDGVLTVNPGAGSLTTKRKFGDIQLHMEWRTPASAAKKGGEGSGNSGIKFHNAYEIQVLNSYKNQSNPMGQAAAVYKQHPPLVNACRAPGEWQTYDIIFRSPYFDKNKKVIKKGTFTVFHNGILVHEVAEIQGVTNSGRPSPPHYKLPFFLQDHGSKVSYRNIWVRELKRKPLD